MVWVNIFLETVSSKTATTHIFQSGVRNWPISVSRCEIEVFNPQARDSRLRHESWQVYTTPLSSGISWVFEPPSPSEFPIPSVVGIWIFSGTTRCIYQKVHPKDCSFSLFSYRPVATNNKSLVLAIAHMHVDIKASKFHHQPSPLKMQIESIVMNKYIIFAF